MLSIVKELGGELVAISPQNADKSRAGARENGLHFPVLCDAGNTVARAYDLVFSVSEQLRELFLKVVEIDLRKYNGDNSWELPLPGTFVLDRKGVVRLAFVQADYSRRMEPSLIVRKLRQLLREKPEPITSVSDG